MYKVSKVNILNSNNYITVKDSKVIIQSPKESNKYLYTGEMVLCDRIEVIPGIGVLYYLNNFLLKRIKVLGLEINYEERTNSINITSLSTGKIITIIYCEKYLNRTELLLDEIESIKYKVGDIVYPDNLYIYDLSKAKNVFGEYHKRSVKSYIYMYIYCQINGTNESLSVKDVLEDNLLDNLAFEVVEIVEDSYYKIKLRNENSELLRDLQGEYYYATDSNLSTLKEIVTMAENSK